jgi:hypothetical protein|tara:strand:- start:1703 stop:2113 length:411 start_codon:yes stop_codon:yes gene_type:complete
MSSILNDLKNISWFFIFPVFVLIAHIFLLFVFDVYAIFPWFDIPMHFVGGVSIGIMYFLILKYSQRQNYLKTNSFFNVLFIFALVSLTAVLWEFFEFSLTYLTGFSLQGNLSDTMLDLFLGMSGGLLTAIFLERIK